MRSRCTNWKFQVSPAFTWSGGRGAAVLSKLRRAKPRMSVWTTLVRPKKPSVAEPMQRVPFVVDCWIRSGE